jgi:hypothetical protein
MAGDEGDEHDRRDWVQVVETRQIFEAELIALRLRGSGIEAEVVDQTFNQEPLPNVRSFAVVRVLVPAESLAEARQVLEQGMPLPEDGESEEQP